MVAALKQIELVLTVADGGRLSVPSGDGQTPIACRRTRCALSSHHGSMSMSMSMSMTRRPKIWLKGWPAAPSERSR
jgi:hypothetical protein